MHYTKYGHVPATQETCSCCCLKGQSASRPHPSNLGSSQRFPRVRIGVYVGSKVSQYKTVIQLKSKNLLFLVSLVFITSDPWSQYLHSHKDTGSGWQKYTTRSGRAEQDHTFLQLSFWFQMACSICICQHTNTDCKNNSEWGTNTLLITNYKRK